jgi:hypothetical protein
MALDFLDKNALTTNLGETALLVSISLRLYGHNLGRHRQE